jgi:lipopolysaccharide transport system permease protein
MAIEKNWDLIVKPHSSWFNLNFSETWRYRNLVLLFVKRDIVAQYKQTILGPIWHILQPALTTLMYILVFGVVAKLSTDGSPKLLFYSSGVVLWSFFSTSLINTSSTFIANAHIFGKIYFPRLVIPISVVVATLIRFFIQLFLFILIIIYWKFFVDESSNFLPNITVILLPLLLIIMGIFALGCGIIISSLTTKYRDLSIFVSFGVQLIMYLTPVVYSASIWGDYQWIMDINPLTYIFESFRYMFMSTGAINYYGLVYSAIFAIIVFLIGTAIFNRVDKSFMDTV